jgi:ankyrin repeat protein
MDIHACCKHGNLERLRVLIAEGIDVNVKEIEQNGWTPLHYASAYGHVDIVRELLSHNAHGNRTNVNEKDNYGNTPLHGSDCIEIIRELINHNAHVNEKDNKGWTPLHRMSVCCDIDDSGIFPELIRELLKHGASVNEKDNSGRTPLYLASRTMLTENVIELINHGANIYETDHKGRTILDVVQMDEMRHLIQSYIVEIKEPDYL